jgi:DNA-binding protein HU-beta
MTKTELEQLIANQLGITRVAARDGLNVTLDAITLALSRQQRVALPGFGTFVVKRLAARQGRNPATGETMAIAASNTVLFRAGARLRAAVTGDEQPHQPADSEE